jgi:hypothetical protein
MWESFRPETLNGTVSIVEPGKKSIFVTTSGGVSYKFVATAKTKIQINGTPSSMDELAEQSDKEATVTFVARPKGDVAQRIAVSS